MPILEHGCCCLKLRTCVRIVAWIEMIVSILGLLFNATFAIAMMYIGPDELADRTKFNQEEEKEFVRRTYNLVVPLAWCLVTFFFMGIVKATLLFLGSYKENRISLEVYCFLSIFTLAVSAIFFIVTFFYLPGLSLLILQGICFGISLYCLLCVYSYYEELKEGSSYA